MAQASTGPEVALTHRMFTDDNLCATGHQSSPIKPTGRRTIREENIVFFDAGIDFSKQTNLVRQLATILPDRGYGHDSAIRS